MTDPIITSLDSPFERPPRRSDLENLPPTMQKGGGRLLRALPSLYNLEKVVEAQEADQSQASVQAAHIAQAAYEPAIKRQMVTPVLPEQPKRFSVPERQMVQRTPEEAAALAHVYEIHNQSQRDAV